MKKFTVGFYYTEMGRVVIEAASEEEAKEKLDKSLDWFGAPNDTDLTDREWEVVQVEEIEQ